MEMTVYRVEVLQRRGSDLLFAYSPDHPGLNVTARSHEELSERLPGAVRLLLEAEGKIVEDVNVRSAVDAPPDFQAYSYIADAELRDAAR